MSASRLKDIDNTLVIQENDQPLAVLLRYEDFIAMQQQLLAVLETQAILSNKGVLEGIQKGSADAASGNTRSLEEVRKAHK